MTQDEQKRAAAREALRYVVDDTWLGVGSGSTVNYFIDELATIRHRIKGAIASSVQSAERLRSHGIDVEDLNNVGDIPVCVDGADEVTASGAMIKGGGGALTREKIVAAVARTFVCIADGSKRVDALGAFPLPVEVVPMARSYLAREMVRLGGRPSWRIGFVTDNGNVILDVADLTIADPIELEDRINAMPGVVTVGLFARRGADVIVLADAAGVHVEHPARASATPARR